MMRLSIFCWKAIDNQSTTASTSRERRGRRKLACRGGAEQCAWVSSGTAEIAPRKMIGTNAAWVSSTGRTATVVGVAIVRVDCLELSKTVVMKENSFLSNRVSLATG